MSIRLLIAEPDEDVLSSYLDYFHRHSDFQLDSANNGHDCLIKLRTFFPHVLMLEPALPRGLAHAILDEADVPVLVLSRISSDRTLRNHPAVSAYHVKPVTLKDIARSVERIAYLNYEV